MKKKSFDYSEAMLELDSILAKVENPETNMEDIGKLLKESRTLIKNCREYLRELRESINEE